MKDGARVTGPRGLRADHGFLRASHPQLGAALEQVLEEAGALPGYSTDVSS